jgi:hypothetical protein
MVVKAPERGSIPSLSEALKRKRRTAFASGLRKEDPLKSPQKIYFTPLGSFAFSAFSSPAEIILPVRRVTLRTSLPFRI